MKNKQKTTSLIYTLIALFMLVVTVIGGRAMLPAFADTSEYTSVLEDLQKDSSFNAAAYPDKRTDYNIQIIQVAESVNGELFVYTYQPSQHYTPLKATCINMSLTDELNVSEESSDNSSGDNQGSGSSSGSIKQPVSLTRSVSAVSSKLYDLKLIDTSNVFSKYVVEDFAVSGDLIRYYNITSIYREPVKSGVTVLSSDNEVNEVACPVGKVWKATTTSDGVKYEVKEVETVTITSKYVGTVRYPSGTKWFTTGACDSHFVAFSTNRKIDTLLEAEVTYITQTYDKKFSGVTYGKEVEKYKSLSCDQIAESKVTGIFAKKYTWKRIQSVSEFATAAKLSEEQKDELSGKQWVLSFAETDYTQGTSIVTDLLIGWVGHLVGSQFSSGTLVSKVSVLSLKFITDGKTYKLGVVDNKQTGAAGSVPGVGDKNESGAFNFWAFLGDCFASIFKGNPTWWQIAVVILVIIVAITVLAIFIWWVKIILRLIFGKSKE
ncbi:MAG: hypothetical protein K2L12_08545 [Clostridia bacterium]|nr:hypothetical protein [Clostridia bacterium]